MKAFRVTYEVVTPESAERGEAAERGFLDENGTQWELSEIILESAPSMSLSHAARALGGRNSCYDSGRWFDSNWADNDWKTGAETRYSLHPPESVTPASYARLRRYFCGR